MGMNSGVHDAFNLADKLLGDFARRGGRRRARPLRAPAAPRRPAAHPGETIRNKRVLAEKDPAVRKKNHDELRRTAEDPKLARALPLAHVTDREPARSGADCMSYPASIARLRIGGGAWRCSRYCSSARLRVERRAGGMAGTADAFCGAVHRGQQFRHRRPPSRAEARRTARQQFVVENRVGASGNMGTEAVARAEPDGYTIGLANTSTHAVAASLCANSATIR